MSRGGQRAPDALFAIFSVGSAEVPAMLMGSHDQQDRTSVLEKIREIFAEHLRPQAE